MNLLGKFQIYLAIAALIAAIGIGAIWYYKDSQHRIEVLLQEKIQLEVALDLQQKTIESIRKDIDAQRIILQDTYRKFDIARQEAQILADKLSKHEIGQLAIQKPKLVENIINKATQEAYRCAEIASGAPLTLEERSATKKSQINNSCTSLANPNYKDQ